jgi:hypothetical protein
MSTVYPAEYQYLFNLVQYRICKSLDAECKLKLPKMPAVKSWNEHLSAFIQQHQLDDQAAVLLLLALAPHVYPHLLDEAIGDKLEKMNFPKIGGTHGKNFRGFLPTGETAFFILSGEDPALRLHVQELFGADHLFAEKKILWLELLPEGEPPLHGRIIMSQDYVEWLTLGRHVTPHFSISFPARRIRTDLSWSDLVISDELKAQIDELKNWLRYNEQLVNDWGMHQRVRKGYRTLFYGPPGTGKTFTAGLLGKEVGRDVYKIDLSMVVSKYIGETEKNLELLFARAEDKGWILFFDEADALFGKRTNVRDAHDKYANQEVSYLLQRIEDYNGLVILATNMKNNIDDAFVRRFNSILKFTPPDAEERARIWRLSFPRKARFLQKHIAPDDEAALREEVDIPEAVKKYQLTGGSILNVVHYASIKALEKMEADKTVTAAVAAANGNPADIFNIEEIADASPRLVIYLNDVLEGIRQELMKEGKSFG